MKPYTYFDNILKHKRYFNNNEIAIMSPPQIRAYRISGHIKRTNTKKEINQLNKLVKQLTAKLNKI